MKKTDKWQWWCKPFSRVCYRMEGQGWHRFDAGIIKIHTMPPEGQSIGKPENYKGIIIRFMWWFPFDKA